MTSRWGCIALVLMACSKPGKGLSIDVRLDGADHAELLVASDETCGSGCSGIGMPNATASTPGVVTFLDSDTRIVGDSGQTHFEIDASTPTKISHVFVLGLDASDQPTQTFAELDDVTIPANGPLLWNAPLGRFAGLFAWREPGTTIADDPSCLHVDGPPSAFYVPRQDRDCDGLRNAEEGRPADPTECDPLWYLRAAAVSNAGWCVRTVNTTSNEACQHGTITCSDGSASSTCDPPTVSDMETVCYPDGMCTCEGGVTECVDPPPQPSLALQCMLVGQTTAVAGNATSPCVGSPNNPYSLVLPPSHPCTILGLTSSPTPSNLTATSPIPLKTETPGVTSSGIMVGASQDMSGPCVLDLNWIGSIEYSVSNVTFDPVYVVVAISSTLYMVVPLEISLQPTAPNACTAGPEVFPFTCNIPDTAAGSGSGSWMNDGMWNCAK
ncbi:MAG TPA: hypothetical protein VMJ10_23985 [Kofleriaceae bacterium]|nr:hypothetical protein [Kofleriaceae bacterium]